MKDNFYFELRKKWKEFFQENGHVQVDSHSLLSSDKKLLLVNSGIAAMRDFLVKQPIKEKNLFSFQPVVRTNDIGKVGKDISHLTFFEMLGNFSFGGYGKEKAIRLAWDFLTSKKWLSLDPKKIKVTCLESDEEAFLIWKRVGNLKSNQISFKGRDSNFWDLGYGPCGPSTEVYYPTCKEIYLEIWNIVFSELHNDGRGNYTPLATKNIDTGAGLERLLLILEKKEDVFLTSIFYPLFKATKRILIGIKCEEWVVRMVADHVRAVVFMIADGILPGNKGANYIIRYLIRRISLLTKVRQPFVNKLVDEVAKIFQEIYPLVKRKKEEIKEIILVEEKRLWKLFLRAEKTFSEMIVRGDKITADDIFVLFASHGYPLEVMKDILEDKGVEVDFERVDSLIAEHQLISKKK